MAAAATGPSGSWPWWNPVCGEGKATDLTERLALEDAGGWLYVRWLNGVPYPLGFVPNPAAQPVGLSVAAGSATSTPA